MEHDSTEFDTSTAEDDATTKRALALRTVLGLLVVFATMAMASLFLKETFTTIGTWIWEAYGLAGLFIGTALADAFTIPIPVDIYLVAAVTANAPSLPVILLGSSASIFGGCIAWWIGIYSERIPFIQGFLQRYKVKGEALFKKWGVATVAVAAWTPLPFSLACWSAGAFNMPFGRFLLTSLNRIPRIALYYYAIKLGWMAGNLG